MILDQLDTEGLPQQGTSGFHRERLLELDVHGFGMGPQHGHPHTGGREAQIRQTHDLPGFIHHFHLLLAVTVLLQR